MIVRACVRACVYMCVCVRVRACACVCRGRWDGIGMAFLKEEGL